MATTQKKRIRAAEFLEMDLGEGPHELARGKVIALSPAGPEHGLICLNIGAILRAYGRRTGHGYALGNDSAVVLAEDTVRGPDVCYFSEARWPLAQVGPRPGSVPPDLAVEVDEPNDLPSELHEKLADYLRAGVLMVWVVYLEKRTLDVHRPGGTPPVVLTESDVLENLPELPGFRCRVAEFFE
jgi:Uma2 family endonuclease